MDMKSLLPWLQTNKDETLLGLDFASNAIKLMQISNVDGVKTIEYGEIFAIPTGLVDKDTIKDPPGLASHLRTCLRKLNIATKSVALAVPRSAVIIKNTYVDARLSTKEIESRAWIEAGQNFPDLIGEINLDYSVIGPSADDPNKLELVLVACRKEQIKPYLDVIKEAGLSAKIVDVNCYAFERALALEKFAPQDVVALLNVDFTLTSLVVMQNGMQIYAHDYSYDGNHLYQMITSEEELQKRNINDILREQFSTHLRHCIHFFYSSRHNIALQKIFLSGDLSLVPALAVYIQSEIGIETQIAKPCQDMKIGSNVDKKLIDDKQSTMVLSCGLALSTLKTL